MNVVYVLAPLALLLSGGFVAAFIWATRSGQWDDLDLTPKKIMQDDQHPRGTNEPRNRNHPL